MLKRLRREKFKRDRKKRDEKLLKSVDGAVMTQHAVDRANQRSVSKQDIKWALRTGKVHQTSAKTFRVSAKGVAVIVAKVSKKRLEDDAPSHVAVVTTWKRSTSTKSKKVKGRKKKKRKKDSVRN